MVLMKFDIRTRTPHVIGATVTSWSSGGSSGCTDSVVKNTTTIQSVTTTTTTARVTRHHHHHRLVIVVCLHTNVAYLRTLPRRSLNFPGCMSTNFSVTIHKLVPGACLRTFLVLQRCVCDLQKMVKDIHYNATESGSSDDDMSDEL